MILWKIFDKIRVNYYTNITFTLGGKIEMNELLKNTRELLESSRKSLELVVETLRWLEEVEHYAERINRQTENGS